MAIKESSSSWRVLLVMLIVAYAFSFIARLIWVYQFGDHPQSFWNDQLMINTNDGYFWAEGALDRISGESNYPSPTTQYISILTAFMYTILPISFETLILYMPAIFGSLLVVPVLLVGRALGMSGAGFVAALIAGIAWSYYNRTMIGYYDTDLLIVVLPAFIVWAIIYTLQKKSYYLLPLAPILIIYAVPWHSGVGQLTNAIFLVTIFYILVFDRKDKFNYKFLSLFALPLYNIPNSIELLLILSLSYAYWHFKDKIDLKLTMAILAAVVVAFMFFGGFNWIKGFFSNVYFVRALVASEEVNLSFKFYEVVNTVREAGKIPFEMFANRISGHPIAFFVSSVGYILLLIRYPIMVISLPMVGLGFFAIQGGLRFTVFAVPFLALGFGYLLFLVAKFLPSIPRVVLITLSTALILYPNIKHIIGYKVPTVFNTQEVKILDDLHKIASREDYVVSWWDYGYPIRYYSDVSTLIDGGKHDGGSNYPVSFMLGYPNQIASANMARLNVEVDMKFRSGEGNGTQMSYMVQSRGYSHPNDLLSALESREFNLPQKSREIYYYLPYRMMEIFPTVKVFSNMDIASGRVYPNPFFYFTQSFQDTQSVIHLGNGIQVEKEGGSLIIGDQKVPIKSFFHISYDKAGKLQIGTQNINAQSPLSVIFMQSYNAFLVLDDNMLNSTYIQLFVFENYDEELFEPVILNPLAKVYRLKI